MPSARAYFDTSVVVKRYVQEPGTREARALMRRYRLLSSWEQDGLIVTAYFTRRLARRTPLEPSEELLLAHTPLRSECAYASIPGGTIRL